MSEEVKSNNAQDRLNISKAIKAQETFLNSCNDKICGLVGSVERIRIAINNKKAEFELLLKLKKQQEAAAEKQAETLANKETIEEPVSVAPVTPVQPAKPQPLTDTKFYPVTPSAPRYPERERPTPRQTSVIAPMPEKNQKKDDFKRNKNQSQDKKKNIDDKYKLNKKAKIQKGYEQSSASVEYDELSGEITKIRARRSSDKHKHSASASGNATVIDHAVVHSKNIPIKLLSEKIGRTASDILGKLLLGLSIQKNINDSIDFTTAELICSEFGVTLELQIEKTAEEMLFEFYDAEGENEAEMVKRPPIVTIMGHVDHGKTSILDYIRKSNVAGGEAGGITQHIGAYTIKVPYEGKMETITFLDTPGHEAFSAMRARGANVTDIIIIVVAADDGIMPQTKEAISHAKAAGVPIIVAINKMDKAGANPDRVIQQLSENGILTEDWMGDVPAVRVSAKTGMGIDDLLQTILVQAEVCDLKANPNRSAKGTIVEAKLDKGKGAMATVLVQNGSLHTGDNIVVGLVGGKIRAMFDDKGKKVATAVPSMPVSILGLDDVPIAGDQLMVVKDAKYRDQIIQERKNKLINKENDETKDEEEGKPEITLEGWFERMDKGKTLNLIIKADVQGSSEALKHSLSLSAEEVKVAVKYCGVGAINESDINLAKTSDSVIIGFNVRPDTNAKALAERLGVQIKTYSVIYDAIDDVEKALQGMLAPKYKEVYVGRAEVRQIFKISNVGTIAGCMVKDGKIVRNAKVSLLRDGKEIFVTSIVSLKRMKDDVKEVNTGYDCGIGLDGFNDIKENDVIEAYIREEVK